MNQEYPRLEHQSGSLSLDHCLVMGILNRTPDSFYDGGRMELGEAIEHGVEMVDDGAEVLDVGGVKAGPGTEVEEGEEQDRLLPLVEALSKRVSVPISIETARVRIARRALEAGASIVNDVSGLLDEGLASLCAATGAGLVLMHTGGQLRGRPRSPRYPDVVAEVERTWSDLESSAQAAGCKPGQLLFDPGLDFGKTTFHSLELVRRLGELTNGKPVLFAASRKDIVGESLGLDLDERLEGSLALVALAAERGAAMVRVHDVRATKRVVEMVEVALGRRPPARPVRGLWE
jgi:dihydropteroate synthase